MKTMPRPSAASRRMTRNSCPTSTGARTAVGSSRVRRWAPRHNGFRVTRPRRAPPVQVDLARVGLLEAVEDLHEGALPGTVLAEQGMDLAGQDLEGHLIVGHEVTEALGDALHPEQLGCAGLLVRAPHARLLLVAPASDPTH